jgi:hypothetical protein
MSIIESNIVLGIGDLIYLRAMFEANKQKFSTIKLSYDRKILNTYRSNDSEYLNFLNEIGDLFFPRPYYQLIAGQRWTLRWPPKFQQDYGINMVIPQLQDLLCRGILLNLSEEYIVITTKIRDMEKTHYQQNIAPQLWSIMRHLSNKYKIVVMGERSVEMSAEYREHGTHKIYSIYEDIMSNIPQHRILDLSIPALGITVPNLRRLQQDCLIMNDAKFVCSLGIGGNVILSVATANTINYRTDNAPEANILFGDNKEYNNSIVTKNPQHFYNSLRRFL